MRAEFHIKGMHDKACEAKIREALETTAGVRKAEVTFHGKTAVVDFDDETVQEKTLIKRIQDAGYNATVADESQNQASA